MSIRIFLDNNVCIPGETISGRIECIFNSQKNLRAIRIKFRGSCNTEWTKSESYYDERLKRTEYKDVEYSATESYLYSEYNLVQGGDNFSLSAGRHVYPFSYGLPLTLPSSFEGSVGHIRYSVKAAVVRPWKSDYKTSSAFTIAPHMDLNLMPNLREPVALSDDKTMCSCWCNDSGALTFKLTLPVSGYAPGQEINIGCYVQNMTNVSVESVQFKIVATTKYITENPTRDTKSFFSEIDRCVERGIGAHGEKSWTSTLRIPTNRKYPNLKDCSIINVRYILGAKVVLPSPHSNMKMKYPITIGSVAISNVDTTIPGPPPPDAQCYLPNDNTSSRNYDLPGFPSAPSAPITELSCLPSSETASAPPPSYEELISEEKK